MRNKLILGFCGLGFLIGLISLWFMTSTRQKVSHTKPTQKTSKVLAPIEQSNKVTPEDQLLIGTLPEPQGERDRKVAAKLTTFIERTSGLNAESVAAEQEKIKAGLKDVQARETETPQSQLIVDEQGEKWERLEFKSGMVRYVPVPKEIQP